MITTPRSAWHGMPGSLKRVLRFGAASLLVALAGATGCATMGSNHPIFEQHGSSLRHATYDYALAADPGTGEILPSAWRLDNFVASAEGLGRPRTDSPYRTTLRFDYEEDGQVDDRAEIPTYDALFRRDDGPGEIFVATRPLPLRRARRDLSRLAEEFVVSAAGAGQVTHDYNPTREVPSARVASRLLASRAAFVSGYEAHEVLFELADVPADQVTDATRWRRGHVVVARPDLTFTMKQLGTGVRFPEPSLFHPVLMILGYAHDAADFEIGHADFVSLVERTLFGMRANWEAESTALARCGDPAPLPILVAPSGLIESWPRGSTSDAAACRERVARSVELPAQPWRTTYVIPSEPRRDPRRQTTVSTTFSSPDAE